MLKASKNPKNWLVLTGIAVIALTLGMFLKLGFSTAGASVNDEIAAQAQQNEVVQEKIPTATASVTEKDQYLPASQSQKVQGIKFTASNFYFQDNHVFVDVCYDLPGNDIWDVNMATLQYGDRATSDFAVNEFFVDLPKDINSKGSRCLKLDFYDIDTKSDLSTLTLIIENIGQIAPAEGHECEGYLNRIKNNPNVSQSGIKVTCDQLPGSSQVKIVKKPSAMSDDDANAILNQAMVGQVNGPWQFTVALNK